MSEHDTHNDSAQPADWGSRRDIIMLVLLAATVLGIYLCFRMALPFLPALAWAVALAVLFAPLQNWLESRGERRGGAAAITVLVIALIVVAPTVFVGQRLIQEAAKGAEVIQKKVETGDWRDTLQSHPRLAAVAERVERQVNLSGALNNVAGWLTNIAGSILKGSLIQVIGIMLTFYLLFFFLRDRRAAITTLRSLSPLSESEMDRMLQRVADTIYATIYGTLTVAAAQGVLGGLMFWWLGLPAPLLWGVVMAFLSVVPVLGAFVVWIPAAIFLFAEGNWAKGLILTIWGAAVVGTVDNLLRPVLVGKRLKLHTLLTFVSLVGGLVVFGGSGLVLGPVILTITIVLLEIWRSRLSGVPADPVGSVPPGGAKPATDEPVPPRKGGRSGEHSFQNPPG